MEKSKNLILIQAFMLLCAFALPFISVYCQEYRNPAPKRTLVRKRPVRRSVARPIAKVTPTTSATDETTESSFAEATADREAEDTEQETEIATSSDTKQAQAATQTPDTWSSNIYRTFAIVLLNSLYKGSETGIGALTKIVIKRFTERRDVLAEKHDLTIKKQELQKQWIQDITLIDPDLSEDTQMAYIKQQPLMKKIEAKEVELEKLEKATSLTAIATTGVYIGLLNTAVPMMGTIMGTAVKLALQMLIPTEG